MCPDQTISRILSPSEARRRRRDDDHLSWPVIAGRLGRATSRLFPGHCSRSENRLLLLHRRGFTARRRCRRRRCVADHLLRDGPRRITFHLSSRRMPGLVLSLWHFPWVCLPWSRYAPGLRKSISRPPLTALHDPQITPRNGVRTFLLPRSPKGAGKAIVCLTRTKKV